MPRTRTVTWDGFANARDLGGLPTTDRQVTRVGRLYRSADVGRVSTDGWEHAWSAGVRTVLDLRNDDEVREQAPLLAGRIARARVTLDDAADVAMWAKFRNERLDGTPLYLRAFLELKPERCAAAVTAIARSAPGGLVFHCAAGRDRTGLVALLLLALAEVDPAAIAADYERSAAELPALFAAFGRPDESAAVDRAMAWHGVTVREAMLSTLEGFDASRYLLDAGVSVEDLAAVRARLRGPAPGTAERAGPDDVEPAVAVWRAASAQGIGRPDVPRSWPVPSRSSSPRARSARLFYQLRMFVSLATVDLDRRRRAARAHPRLVSPWRPSRQREEHPCSPSPRTLEQSSKSSPWAPAFPRRAA